MFGLHFVDGLSDCRDAFLSSINLTLNGLMRKISRGEKTIMENWICAESNNDAHYFMRCTSVRGTLTKECQRTPHVDLINKTRPKTACRS